jgi:hypothetical protein
MEINNIFLKNNCDDEDLKYQTTSGEKIKNQIIKL